EQLGGRQPGPLPRVREVVPDRDDGRDGEQVVLVDAARGVLEAATEVREEGVLGERAGVDGGEREVRPDGLGLQLLLPPRDVLLPGLVDEDGGARAEPPPHLGVDPRQDLEHGLGGRPLGALRRADDARRDVVEAVDGPVLDGVEEQPEAPRPGPERRGELRAQVRRVDRRDRDREVQRLDLPGPGARGLERHLSHHSSSARAVARAYFAPALTFLRLRSATSARIAHDTALPASTPSRSKSRRSALHASALKRYLMTPAARTTSSSGRLSPTSSTR